MIKIVGKGYKYILKQLGDFSGETSETTISLKSEEGRKKFKEYFGKNPEGKQKKKKVRIISIFQTRFIDFSTKIIEKIKYIKESICENICIRFREKLKIEPKKKKSKPLDIFQTKLTDLIDGILDKIKKRTIRLPYKIKPVKVTGEKYMEGILPEDQILAFEECPTFHGYLSNMFALNPSFNDFFMNLQLTCGYTPQHCHDFLNFNNIFKLEIARCKLGYAHFDKWVAEFNQNKSLRIELGMENCYQLTVRSYLRNLNIIGFSLKRYADQLIQECRDLKLINDKIWIWDRRFFECNCTGVKKDGKLADPDAGHYVKKTGKYSILTGTGYTDTGIVDSAYGLPIYWDAVGAHLNDNTIFKNTVIESTKSTPVRPIFMISDAGPDSHDSNELVLNYRMIPVIAARYNSVGDILKTEDGDCFRGEYIPRKYHGLLNKIYDLRTIIERRNSNEVVGYNRSEMPTRGINWARCFVSISNITALLTGLTAFKTGRLDLIRSPSAFRRLLV